MKDEASITAAFDADMLAMVDRLAVAKRMTGAAYAIKANRCVAESDDDLRAVVQLGIDAADRGEVVAHEEAAVEVDAMIAKHEARCSA